MSLLFYNIASISLGVIILIYNIISFARFKRVLVFLLGIMHSLLLLGGGITGFFIPEDYSYIIIIALLVIAISYILVLIFIDKKREKRN